MKAAVSAGRQAKRDDQINEDNSQVVHITILQEDELFALCHPNPVAFAILPGEVEDTPHKPPLAVEVNRPFC